MMWIWLSLGAFVAWVLFVDLVWNAETKLEKADRIDLDELYKDGWN